MVDIKTLLPELKKLVTELSEDLLARSTATAEIDAGLREAYTQIEKGGRTADAFEVWREDYLDQVAVAWVLSCVFVRFMEDNHLIDECWLAGEGDRRKQAEDSHELYFREHPRESDREYFEHVFHEVGKIPACHDLFAEGKTPLWAVGPSGDAAMKLLGFWREIDTDRGHLKRTFDVEDGDTRFVGDLYQDLSERARKKYALLQTPVFVEEFILDRTLNPAIDEFGLDEVRMIDPTCGSGHFLLGGFSRLFDLWVKREDNDIVAAQKALDGIWGVDINPFAVAIARFRLIVASLMACGISRLKNAPQWHLHLATGDSLLFGNRWDRDGRKKGEQQFFSTEEESWAPEIYACEDKEAISEVLGQQYHAVVGNPPYITVKDKSLNQAYRDRYSTCYRSYSLGVPFTERFFDLGRTGALSGAGYVGMITANSFMKREFGKQLITDFFPRTDLTHVIDTSGAYIPGHGTPTVILLGRNRDPQGDTVRAVLGIKGEPSTPADPSQGHVWLSILNQIDLANAEDDFTSTADVGRAIFAKHPWSLSGGGATDVKKLIEGHCKTTLADHVDEIGFGAVTREDDAYLVTGAVARRHGISEEYTRPLVAGDEIRDWTLPNPTVAIFPYDPETLEAFASKPTEKFLWPWKTQLSIRVAYGNSQLERGLKWYEYSMFFSKRFRTPTAIGFAFVATHNHFVFDRGGKVFNRSAPIIKLKAGATEEEHLTLLGLLNSSTSCFWMKQVFFPKGGDHVGQEGARVRRTWWDERYEFAGTQMQKFPVPQANPYVIAQQLDSLAIEYSANLPQSIVTREVPTSAGMERAKEVATSARRKMISLQEELDWQCYQHFGVLKEDLCYACDDLPDLELGQRAFEIVMARNIAAGNLTTAWFDRHGSQPITEYPRDWPEAYCKTVDRRIELIESTKEIRLIEKPEFKRRWNTETWQDQQQRALREWLLSRLEGGDYWPSPDRAGLRLQSVSELADKASGDSAFLQVAAIYRGRNDFDMSSLVGELVESETVPLIAADVYKPSGLRKRRIWEKVWENQRKHEAGEIKVPPKYSIGDFQKSDYWRMRGKLDVPKERWISFPHCETEGNPSLVVGWAGWNHLQQGTAIVAYYDARKNEGWSAERLTPLLAALDQLLPWIHQWHPEIDPEYNETAGTSFQTLLESEAQELGLTLEQIRSWTPPAKKRATKKKAAKKPRKKAKSAEATEGE